jgi:hypothetical protein
LRLAAPAILPDYSEAADRALRKLLENPLPEIFSGSASLSKFCEERSPFQGSLSCSRKMLQIEMKI